MVTAAPERQSGWVIERYINSELFYWEGRSTDRHWSRDHNDAIRFARAQDAGIILAWLLDGQGRAAEHVWTPRA